MEKVNPMMCIVQLLQYSRLILAFNNEIIELLSYAGMFIYIGTRSLLLMYPSENILHTYTIYVLGTY